MKLFEEREGLKSLPFEECGQEETGDIFAQDMRRHLFLGSNLGALLSSSSDAPQKPKG